MTEELKYLMRQIPTWYSSNGLFVESEIIKLGEELEWEPEVIKKSINFILSIRHATSVLSNKMPITSEVEFERELSFRIMEGALNPKLVVGMAELIIEDEQERRP